MLAVILGAFAAVCWSLHDLVARSYAPRLGALRLAFGVVVMGGVLLTPLVFSSTSLASLGRDAILVSLVLGLAYGAGIGGLFKALSLGPISLVGPVTATYPALVVLWNIAEGVWPTPLQAAAVLAALAGAVIVSRSGHHDGGLNAVARQNVVQLFAACAISMVCYAAAVVLGQKAGVLAGEYPATWISRFSAALVLLPFLRSERQPEPLKAWHGLGVVAMGLLDIAGQVAVNMTGTLPGHEFTAIGIATYGAVSTLLAAIFLKERVSPGQWGGIALIVAGVAGVSVA
jgi:drug/metabolite transporter (DMT)-like permease